MSKYFRPWNIDQTLLLPPNVQDFVPKGHVSRFIVELVRESLDLQEITGSYVSGLGQPPFDPRMMVALLLHGYASGLYSSRRIAKACRERNDFVMIVALDPPDFRTISDFRKRHLKALGALFLQVLKLCETAGLVKLGHVALDGTKIKANASKHKAMSYERMKKRGAELKAEVARMLAAAEAADSGEDETFGQDKRDNDVMIAVRRDVLKATGGRQEPWDQSSLREHFRFCEFPAINAQIEAVQPPASVAGFSDEALLERAAIEHWEAVKGTTDPNRLREFLSDYGTSRMGKLAREALQRQATANWQGINKRDEWALAKFIDVYPGAYEIAEASTLLAVGEPSRRRRVRVNRA